MTLILIKPISLSNWWGKLLIFGLILGLVHKIGTLSSFYLGLRACCYFHILLYLGYDMPLPPPPALSSSPHPVFFPVNSTNIGICPNIFWFLVLTILPHCRKVSRPYLVPVPNYWTLTKTIPWKGGFYG